MTPVISPRSITVSSSSLGPYKVQHIITYGTKTLRKLAPNLSGFEIRLMHSVFNPIQSQPMEIGTTTDNTVMESNGYRFRYQHPLVRHVTGYSLARIALERPVNESITTCIIRVERETTWTVANGIHRGKRNESS